MVKNGSPGSSESSESLKDAGGSKYKFSGAGIIQDGGLSFNSNSIR
jgi:hypothetical protein